MLHILASDGLRLTHGGPLRRVSVHGDYSSKRYFANISTATSLEFGTLGSAGPDGSLHLRYMCGLPIPVSL